MATDRACDDAMHTYLPGSPPLSSNVCSPNGSGHDLDGMVNARSMHSSKCSEIFCCRSHVDSQILTTTSRPSVKPWVWSLPELPVLNRPSMPSLPRWRCLQQWNRTLAPLLHACARSKEIWSQPQVFQVLQDLGMYLVKTMAPQPQGLSGPMAQVHLRTTGTHDEDLILPQAPRMSNHEVPFYYDSLVNNTSKELQCGSIIFGKNPICQHTTILSDSIEKQVPCPSGLFLKHEPNVKTLLLDKRMMVFLVQLTVPSAAPMPISQCVNPDPLESERLENNLCLLWENWLNSLKFSFLMMTKVFSSFQRSTLAHMSSASKIEEMELANWFSNLLRLEADKHLLLLRLICLFLVFRLKCCKWFSLRSLGPHL